MKDHDVNSKCSTPICSAPLKSLLDGDVVLRAVPTLGRASRIFCSAKSPSHSLLRNAGFTSFPRRTEPIIANITIKWSFFAAIGILPLMLKNKIFIRLIFR